jgi:DNA polymerase-1
LLQAIRRRNGKRAGKPAKEDKADWAVLLGTEDEKLLFEYGPLDAWYTLQLHLLFMERINGWIQPSADDLPLKQLYQTELWVLLALRDMEERGIYARRNFLEQWRDGLVKERDVAYRRLWKLAGKKEVNWNSPQQIQQLLYGQKRVGGLGLMSDRTTGKGNPSTDKIALVLMAHPIGQALLAYRKIQKEITDANSTIEHIRSDTHAIHATFNQNVQTGRMSCQDPNMQNRKRESEMRKAFRARKGLHKRSADYSQVELRIAACIAKEQALLTAFRTGEDPHTATSRSMFGLTEVTQEQRVHGKTLNFAGIFGAGAPGIAEQLMAKMTSDEARRSCRKLGYTPSYGESPWMALAQILVGRHRRMMPAISRAAKKSEHQAKRWGMAMNRFGRHRYFFPDEDPHIAFNTDVQGTAADLIKRAISTIYQELQVNRGEVALLLQVHDEIVYETAGDPRTDKRVKEIMEDHTTFEIPLIADIKDTTISWKHKREIPGL